MKGESRWGRRVALGVVLALGSGLCSLAQAGQALTIGAIVPQSWPSATEGEEIVLGMQLAIKTWPGQPVPTLVIKDSACDPRKGEAAARELVAAKVDLVLGSWCAIGQAPKVVSEAGLPYVSAHAERLQTPPPGVLQLGRQELYLAERMATNLRAETGLRISGRTSCWMDFEPILREQYDAILCPVLGYDKSRWQQAEATFTAANRRPFTYSVARGYAAMEAGLAQLRRLRSGSKGPAEPIVTILGPLPPADAPPPPDAMQLVLSPKLPKLSPKDQAAVNQLLQTKACTCLLDNSCGKGPWADQPFVVRGNSAKCATLASSAIH
ncbi:ABC transporter substrate-binding protein [Ideonella sp.]|uniref:ABC transporter substrate-binding protein n=1 Tax=Ideonella sp. TaxID=1929293 RepID=UPI0035B49F5B